MELQERIQQLEQINQTLLRRIAKLEAKQNGDKPKKQSKYVPKIKGVVKTKADAHAYIENRFQKRKLKSAA